jgi:ribose transport system substrate-binding protein
VLFMGSRNKALLALASIVALLAVACGGGSKTSSTATGGSPTTAGSSGVAGGSLADAQASAAKYETIPTHIVQTAALTAKPPKKKVGYMVCFDPTTCPILEATMKKAIDTLGWSVITVNATATDPGSAIQQLIDAGVDYIAEVGNDTKAFQTQAAELQAKHIPLFECYATDVPAGPTNNVYSDCNDTSAAKVYSAALADWVIADSGGKAHTLTVAFGNPILAAQVNAAHAELSSKCPACKTSDLNVAVTDLTSGAIPQAVASYLQTHTDVNYVWLTYSGLDGGVAKALQSISAKVKVVGTQAQPAELHEIIAGTETAWTALSLENSSWTMADQMARLAANQWSTSDERTSAVPPFYIVSTPDKAKALLPLPDGWPGPAGFQDAFKKLWGV